VNSAFVRLEQVLQIISSFVPGFRDAATTSMAHDGSSSDNASRNRPVVDDGAAGSPKGCQFQIPSKNPRDGHLLFCGPMDKKSQPMNATIVARIFSEIGTRLCSNFSTV